MTDVSIRKQTFPITKEPKDLSDYCDFYVLFLDGKVECKTFNLENLRQNYLSHFPAVSTIEVVDETLAGALYKMNERSRAWVAEVPGRWSSGITEDLNHWASYGIFTVEQFDEYERGNLEKERRKSGYQG